MEIMGYFAAALVGVALGMLGGGGSILAVPILVYLFAQSINAATGYSLFIVAVTAGIGAALMYRRGNVHLRFAAIFALPAFAAVILTRRFLLPTLPHHFANLGPLEITRDRAILILFAGLMSLTALSLLRRKTNESERTANGAGAISQGSDTFRFLLSAVGVGIITGLGGAGGGFLIVPALVLFARLPMKQATGTSLLIIAANSMVGFLSDNQIRPHADWQFLFTVTAAAIIGMTLGVRLAPHVPESRLRPAFAVFLLLMAVYMTGREILSAWMVPTVSLQPTIPTPSTKK